MDKENQKNMAKKIGVYKDIMELNSAAHGNTIWAKVSLGFHH